mmetsp:Transcript_9331/g.23396  ORF Transcript_9331/g.23396 Transcript_9331/m.23396 type:complete len:228 (-) Transcript_9331:368-1051(-)
MVAHDHHRKAPDNILNRRLQRAPPLAGILPEDEAQQQRRKRPRHPRRHHADKLRHKNRHPEGPVEPARHERDPPQHAPHPHPEVRRRADLRGEPNHVRARRDVLVGDGAGGEGAGLQPDVAGDRGGQGDEADEELVAVPPEELAERVGAPGDHEEDGDFEDECDEECEEALRECSAKRAALIVMMSVVTNLCDLIRLLGMNIAKDVVHCRGHLGAQRARIRNGRRPR